MFSLCLLMTVKYINLTCGPSPGLREVVKTWINEAFNMFPNPT